MPVWLIASLITAAVLLAAWWAETRAAVIIAELQAIHEALDKLGSYAAAEEHDNESDTVPAAKP